MEFALLAPVLFFLLLGTLEVGMVGMMTSALDNAVVDAARAIRTGREDGPSSASEFEGWICSRMGGDPDECRERLVVSVRRFDGFAEAREVEADNPTGFFDKGSAGDILLVRANYRWSLITPMTAQVWRRTGATEVTLDARAAFKNEPFE